jgi:hypothetical protein
MALGIDLALREHKRIGNPIVTWDRAQSRVVIIPPEAIEVADDPDDHR